MFPILEERQKLAVLRQAADALVKAGYLLVDDEPRISISDVTKYEGKKGWRTIFARVLVGFLDAQPDIFEDFDLIVASPTFIGDRPYDHTREVILAADWEAEGAWPFDDGDPPAIVKSTATPSMAGKTWQQRRQIAEGPLRGALCVPRPARTQGKSILVYDDVFTDGSTLDEVARCLRADGGAQWVCGVTLTRQPWGGAR